MPLSARLGTTPFDIEMTVRLQPKPAFDINRNGRSTSPKYAHKVDSATPGAGDGRTQRR